MTILFCVVLLYFNVQQHDGWTLSLFEHQPVKDGIPFRDLSAIPNVLCASHTVDALQSIVHKSKIMDIASLAKSINPYDMRLI